MKTLTITLALAAAALSAGVAQAQSFGASPSVVRYSDLNINDPAGARALLGRIRTAAIRECGGRPSSPMQINAVRLHEVCVDATTGAAVGRIGSPSLMALWRPQSANALVRGR